MTGHTHFEPPVWIVWSDLDQDSEVLTALDDEFRIAAPSERDRATKISGTRRAKRYLCGHIALRLALWQTCKAPSPGTEYLRASSGKPRLPGSNGEFSYSSSAHLAIVAVHERIPVGVDIETKAPVHFRDAGLDRMANELPLISLERTDAVRLPPPDGLAGWMLLEAFTKLRGERLAENLSRSRPQLGVLDRELRSADGSVCAVRFALAGHHIGICCAGLRAVEFKIKRLDLRYGSK